MPVAEAHHIEPSVYSVMRGMLPDICATEWPYPIVRFLRSGPPVFVANSSGGAESGTSPLLESQGKLLNNGASAGYIGLVATGKW